MIRSILGFGGFALAVCTALLIGLQKTGRFDVLTAFTPLPEIDAAFQRGFRSDLLAYVNRMRIPGNVEAVKGDEELQNFLISYVESQPDPTKIDLDLVFNSVQQEFPGAQYLAANLVTSTNREELMGRIKGWSAVGNPDFNTINTSVFKSGRQLGVLGVMSRRIPRFSLRTANEKGGKFYNKCPHCDEVHALELERDSRTIILSCPYCDLPFDVLASDSSDTIRRATEFFEGINLEEENLPENLSSEARVLRIWQTVSKQCKYELDQEDGAMSEVWKRPTETWYSKAGDCEDTSILLADALITAGFPARVAIGWNGNIGQHAWVVALIDGKEYVLESTLEKNITRDDLAEVEAASSFYQPEQLFDREHMYYTTARPENFRVNYFSPELWKQIPSMDTTSTSEFSLR